MLSTMLPIEFHKSEEAAYGIFCCTTAAPVISHGAFKIHQDSNRDVHDAVFHSFMSYAIKMQRKATLRAIAMSHLQEAESAGPSDGHLLEGPPLNSGLPPALDQSLTKLPGPSPLAKFSEGVLPILMTVTTQPPTPDQSSSSSASLSLPAVPTESISITPSLSIDKGFVLQKHIRGSLPPGLAAAFAEHHKRAASSNTTMALVLSKSSTESLNPDQAGKKPFLSEQRLKGSKILDQTHSNLLPSWQVTRSMESTRFTKLNSLDQNFKELRLSEKKTQDLICPIQAQPVSPLTASAYSKALIPSSSHPILVGTDTILRPFLLADNSPQAGPIFTPVLPASASASSSSASMQQLPFTPSSILTALSMQTPVVPMLDSNFEQLRSNPLSVRSAYVIHLTSRVDYGPVYSHRYFVCPEDLQEDWTEISKLQWWAQGEPFKYKAEKWDFKCRDHTKFFRMTLRPNLSLRGTEDKAATDQRRFNGWK